MALRAHGRPRHRRAARAGGRRKARAGRGAGRGACGHGLHGRAGAQGTAGDGGLPPLEGCGAR
jgi:hypothetical protein